MKVLLVLLSGLLLSALALPLSAAGAAGRAPDVVTVGVIDNNEPGYRSETVTPTMERLRSLMPEFRFQTVEIAAFQAIEDINRTKPDFVVAPSDVFLNLINEYGAQAIAMRKTTYAQDATRSTGATIVVLKSRKDLQTLDDLAGRNIAASLPDSLSGWLALSGELKAQGKNPDAFFHRVDFMTFQIPDVVNSVFAGFSDAGVLSACQLEAAEAQGLVEKEQFRVLNAWQNDGLRCRHSTALYPDQVFGVLNFTRPKLLKQVSVALLTMPEQPSFSWQVPGKFDAITALYRSLELGQWAPVKRTILDYLKLFWKEIALLAGAILLLAYNEWRLRRLVTVRTADLNAALEAQKALIAQDREMRNRIARMERNSLVAQMSSLIAHELKQPLAAIINYATVQQIRLEGMESADPTLERTSGAIDREAHRIVQIVDRVRSYMRATPARRVRCALSDIARQALLSFSHYADYTPNIDCVIEDGVFVNGDELEIEILVLNLLKNAAQAIAETEGGRIVLSVRREGDFAVLAVRDNGPRLTDVAFQRLTHTSDSTTPGGLGLGLGIIRSIADAHSATLNITRLDPRGIEFTVHFDFALGESS